MATLLPLAVRFPFVGVYQWTWLSLMNPHRLVYGFIQGQQLNLIVAVVTILAWLFSRERSFKMSSMLLLIGAFSIWISLTTFFAPVPDASFPLWDRNIKTMVLLIMILMMVTTKTRLLGLLWIIVISIAYFGVKGGGFMLLTGGNFRVFGPPQTMIEDNNSLALALVMILPLMNYLRLQATNRWIKWSLLGAMFPVLASVLGSYSRGGLVALMAMLLFMWTKSRAKALLAILFILGAGLGAMLMPTQYIDRINTLGEVEADSSFQGRVDAWRVASQVALDRPLGAGFDGPRQAVIWNRYLPEAPSRAAHSIYFMVLGEQGVIGLLIYLVILAVAWANLGRVIRLTKGSAELVWAHNLATALKIAIVGFMVGGAALSMSYYDGFLILVVVTASLRQIVTENSGVRIPQVRLARPPRAPAPNTTAPQSVPGSSEA